MAMMKSLRSFCLMDRAPVSVSVKADTPVFVPPMLQKAAIAAGMIFCEDQEKQTAEVFKAPEGRTELTRDQRDALINKAFAKLVETNVSTDFTASGTPTSGAIFRETEQKVPQKDINVLYAEFKIPKDE